MPDYVAAELPKDPRLDGEFLYYNTVGGLAREAEALNILRRCARVVSPITRNHGWSLTNFKELPSDCDWDIGYLTNGLYNDNWRTIALRLREHKSPPNTFRSMQNIMQTLLHELAHITVVAGAEDHGLEFHVSNVALLRELEGSMVRGEVSEDEVPTRAKGAWEVKHMDAMVLAAPENEPRVAHLLAETSFWPQLRTYRVYTPIECVVKQNGLYLAVAKSSLNARWIYQHSLEVDSAQTETTGSGGTKRQRR